MSPPATDSDTTLDHLLDGRVRLRQPAQGYRVAIDPVFLASAVPAGARDTVLDLGCGVGAASLCLAVRVPQCTIVGVELQPEIAALARVNVIENGFGNRITIVEGDVTKFTAAMPFDHVMANPPFAEAGTGTASAERAKQVATVEAEAQLADWLVAALTLAKPGGSVTFIQRAVRLFDLLREIEWIGAGAAVVFPLWPKGGADAKRVIVQARTSSKAPLRMAAGLVLHAENGAYTAAAQAVLRGGAKLQL